ncbi:unnamed protein product [Closterium sp. NIES-54]
MDACVHTHAGVHARTYACHAILPLLNASLDVLSLPPSLPVCMSHRRTALLAEYAYVLAPGGILYSITDVEELGTWMDDHLAAHPLFRKLTAAQMEADPVIPLLSTSSEEGLKVQRNGGRTFLAVYERVAAPATDKA